MNIYPDHPGFKEKGGTSQLAAEAIANKAGRIADRILLALRDRDMSADQCANYIGESILTVRPRFSELEAGGKIKKTDIRTINASGKQAVVWRIKENEGEA